jgi:GAG-pre-integrase domain
MKLMDNDDPKTHLNELKTHFQLMLQRRDNLMKIGSTISDTQFNTIIMSSLPESYRPTLQTITAAERASKLSGQQANAMKADDLITFIIEEAQHRVINKDRMKSAESALAACTKKASKPRQKKKDKQKSDITCENCDRPGHSKPDCWSKGGGKEGQAPRQKKKEKSGETIVVVAGDDKDDLFMFTCTSDYVAVADTLEVPKSKLGTCMDSGASRHYCLDRTKFTDYKAVERKITTADGRTLTTTGVGDLHIDLPNGSRKTKTILKGAVHAPDMAFTLISISRLDKAGFSVLFNKGMCTIKDTSNKMIATIPNSNGLYKIAANKQTTQSQSANVVSGKMTISEAHRKLGHVLYGAIKHAVSKGFINGITIDPDSKPDFCEACAKAKSAQQPFPQESNTRAENYGERVHWDLWGPASMKILSGNSYVAASWQHA